MGGVAARQAAHAEAARRPPAALRYHLRDGARPRPSRRQGVQAGAIRGGLGGLSSWSKRCVRPHFSLPIRPSVQMPMEWALLAIFDPSKKPSADGSKNANLSYSHAGLDAWTDRKSGNGVQGHSDHQRGPGLCAQCHGEEGAPPTLHNGAGYPPDGVWLHKECGLFWLKEHNGHADDRWADYPEIPPSLRRNRGERLGSPEDDVVF